MVAGVALLAVSCGYVGDPLPPALHIPQPVQDLRVQQVESQLEVAFTIPPKTTDNLPTTDLTLVELRVGRMPEGGWNQDAWAAGAKAIALDATEPGPAEGSVDVKEYAGQEIVAAVRMETKKRRSSAWSNLAIIRIEPPVITPTDFVADSAADGAVLHWKGHDGPMLIFRDGAPVGEGAHGSFTDKGAVLGKTYSYEIQARGDKAHGKRSAERRLTIEDRFPPAAPAGLQLAAGAGTLELTWTPNPEGDVLGYIVQRAVGDGPFADAANYLDAPAYTDRNVQRGMRYRYRVMALDLRKNQSATSQEVEITVP